MGPLNNKTEQWAGDHITEDHIHTTIIPHVTQRNLNSSTALERPLGK